MNKVTGRPPGVTFAAIIVAIVGIVSLAEAFTDIEFSAAGVQFTTIGLVEAILAAAIGIALLNRAYGLWNLRPRAWLITLIVLSVRAILSLSVLLATPASVAAWVKLAVAAAAILYLIQPFVRRAFSDR